MAALTRLYGITDENLALRRRFIGLDDDTLAVLRDLRAWADRSADAIAAELTGHHFRFAPTLAFFEAYVAGKGITVADLRAGWQAAQAAHFRAIFAEATKPRPFGLEYFEGLLRVGAVHNTIDLPLKWYLGSYPAFLDSVRRHLAALPGASAERSGRGPLGRRRRRSRDAARHAELRARAERAIATVFNYDMQAITDAFYYDTFSTLGVDLAQITVSDPRRDLSDSVAELKETVSSTLRVLVDSARSIGDVAVQVDDSIGETGRAIAESAAAIDHVAKASDRQARMLGDSRRLVEEVTESTLRAQALSESGVEAADEAERGMAGVRESAQSARAAIGQLAERSARIGDIVGAIGEIADQTNLLALNAAIEAARAGEHGRGFAVVAEEVRRLAEQSASSAESIGELIAEIQEETSRVVALVDDAAGRTEAGAATSQRSREAFVEIGDAIRQIAERMQRTTADTAEIAATAEESSASAQQVAASTQQTSAATEQVSASVNELRVTAEQLDRVAGRLKLEEAVAA